VRQGTAQLERSKVSVRRETPFSAVKDSREIITFFVCYRLCDLNRYERALEG
jgi:hypothetical protein